jgi:predicted DNA-binding transcriptional regulator AlpA
VSNLLLNEKEVTEFLKIHRATLWRAIKSGHLPAPIKIGTRLNRWRVADIEKSILIAQ